MSSSGCIYVLVSSEQFSVVSCIQIVISSIHYLHIQLLELRIIVYFSFLLPWDTIKKFVFGEYANIIFMQKCTLVRTHIMYCEVDYECTWLRLFQKRIGYIKSKKSLKIPKGQSESVYRRRTDNTMGGKKYKRTNNHYLTLNTIYNSLINS
jgi:hypothetical protein